MLRKQVSPAVKLASVRVSLRRWQTRATRASTTISKLLKQERYYEKLAAGPVPSPRSEVPEVATPPMPAIIEAAKAIDELEVPPFLRRAPRPVDAKAVAEIETAKAAKKAVKTKARLAKMKAIVSGQTRKMPLSGKAALAFIAQA